MERNEPPVRDWRLRPSEVASRPGAADADLLSLEAWYNRTLLDGSAQRAGKRAPFPYYDIIGFSGVTDVDSMSTGFRLAASWGDPNCEHLTAGLDLRYLKQELTQFAFSASSKR